jgi:hypothetical protein
VCYQNAPQPSQTLIVLACAYLVPANFPTMGCRQPETGSFEKDLTIWFKKMVDIDTSLFYCTFGR